MKIIIWLIVGKGVKASVFFSTVRMPTSLWAYPTLKPVLARAMAL